ncbi:glycosyltransferase [Lyngbya sp. PCC 8106]|uniref:glycosyltransferase n=1 Tax=Lyngbya sp. (strain PCC 8106) TaxID=313612 RepID=UPI0000EAC78F|nr:glycosyltransferase [Lyngbya sp. PCC 8106]EAW38834.1 glycosyltransferase [Lyngbya sp. PCC 8106]
MPKHNKFNKIHLWLPNMFEFKGGIQVYSSFFLEALQNINSQIQYDVFLKHDTQASDKLATCKNTNFHFSGTWPMKARTGIFASQILSSGILQHPDLIISTHLNFTIAADYLKRLRGIPYWTIAHGIEAWNIQNPARKKALHNADKILCVSNYTRNRLIQEQHLDPKKLSLLPNTFDSNRFTISSKSSYLLERYKLKPEQPIILTVNRLVSQESYRGYDKILEVLPQIRQAIPNIHYIIAGKGDDRPRLEQSIAQHKLQDCVTLAGFVPDSELCDHYNLCDVFAMPSKLEGFGIVFLEALACGKPVLAGNQDGAIDALYQGELGALVNPDDTKEITQTLIKILQQTYPLPLMYQPEKLRKKVIEIYGFEQFTACLNQYISNF